MTIPAPAMKRVRQREWLSRRRTERRAAGLCPCGREPKPGGALCARCLEIASVGKKRRRAKRVAMSATDRAYLDRQLQGMGAGR